MLFGFKDSGETQHIHILPPATSTAAAQLKQRWGQRQSVDYLLFSCWGKPSSVG